MNPEPKSMEKIVVPIMSSIKRTLESKKERFSLLYVFKQFAASFFCK